MVKVDVLLGDFDRDLTLVLQGKAIPHEIVLQTDQDKTDLEKAFDYLYKGTFHCKCCLGYRKADHTITNLTNIVRYRKVKDRHIG
jgi:thiamine pyrophosphokinase